jgi:hypothetical protein
MTYLEKLNDQRWIEKRNEILTRDNNVCQNCNMKPYDDDFHLRKPMAFAPLNDFLNDFSLSIKGIDKEGLILNSNDEIYTENPGYLIYEFQDMYNPNSINPEGQDLPRSILRIEIRTPIEKENFNLWVTTETFSNQKYENLFDKIRNRTTKFILINHIEKIRLENYLQIKNLNVHHKLYIRDREPWNYTNNHLITLCNVCHKHEHKTKKIYVYPTENVLNNGIECEICSKCEGSGYLKEFHYYMNGVCFECNGEGVNISRF